MPLDVVLPSLPQTAALGCAALRCAALCCAVLCCAVLCCAGLSRLCYALLSMLHCPCCAVPCRAVPCCAVLCCAVLYASLLSPSPSGCTALWLYQVQIGRQGQHSLRQGRETLAQFSEWMLNRGFLFPRSALPAAKSYAAGQLRLTWLDAGPASSIQTFLQACGDPFADVVCLLMLLEPSSNNSSEELLHV